MIPCPDGRYVSLVAGAVKIRSRTSPVSPPYYYTGAAETEHPAVRAAEPEHPAPVRPAAGSEPPPIAAAHIPGPTGIQSFHHRGDVELQPAQALLAALHVRSDLSRAVSATTGLPRGTALAVAAVVFAGESPHHASNSMTPDLVLALELASALRDPARRDVETDASGAPSTISSFVHADLAGLLEAGALPSIVSPSPPVPLTFDGLRAALDACIACDNLDGFFFIDRLLRVQSRQPHPENRQRMLVVAAQRGAVLIARHLVEEYGVPPLGITPGGETPLHIAARHGKANVTGYLVNRIATMIRVAVPSQLGTILSGHMPRNSLIQLARRDPSLIPLVWEDASGRSVQHAAMMSHDAEILRILRRCGARFDVCSQINGITPAHCAVTEGNVAAIRFLADHFPAALCIPNAVGDSPLDLAHLCLREDSAEDHKNEIIAILVKAGARRSVVL